MTAIGHGWHRASVAPRRVSRPASVHASSLALGARTSIFVVATITSVALLSPAVVTAAPDAIAARAAAGVSAPSPRSILVERMGELEAQLAAASAAHEAADGHVLDEGARVALTREVEFAERLLGEARSLLVWPEASLRPGAEESAAAALGEGEKALGAAQEELETAVAAWEAEQARIAAEEAARVAAAAAAAAAAASARSTGWVPAGGGIAHVEGVWTTGGQAQIDACRGSVNVSGVAGWLGAALYAAEHWSCGGSAWGRIGPGALVDFPGYGTYRVAGIVSGLAYGSDASALPRGYAAYYQTCIGGSSTNMAVWLLEPA